MYIRPKHIVVLTIMLFVSTFLLSEFDMLAEADYACYYIYHYVSSGFPELDEATLIDGHTIVAFWFYLFLISAVIIFYFIKNNTVNIPLGTLIFSAIIASVFLLFENMEIEYFYWENVFSPLVVATTYILVFVLWKIQFPEIRFKKSKIKEEYKAQDLTV